MTKKEVGDRLINWIILLDLEYQGNRQNLNREGVAALMHLRDITKNYSTTQALKDIHTLTGEENDD